MTALCDERDAFFDGELEEGDAAAFRDHLVGCAACERALRERVQIDARIEDHRAEIAALARPAPRRRPLRRLAPLAGALALAAGVALFLHSRAPRRPEGDPRLALASELAPARGLEVRFSYPPLDTYRPYGPTRGERAAHDVFSMQTLAAMDAAHAFRGVAAALALSGQSSGALDQLDKAGDSPEATSDRAALAIGDGDPKRAIDLLESVVGKGTGRPQALWNEALAMAALRLPLVAADTFDEVAALGEPGWSDEARRRAAELRAAYAAHRKEWTDLQAQVEGFVLRGELPAADALAAHPSAFRNVFYHALALAPSMERVNALRPIAVRLDGGDPRGPLTRHIDAVSPGRLEKRRPFVARYRALYEDGRTGDGSDAAKLVAELLATGDDDFFFGAVDLARMWSDHPGDVARIAARSGDPWMRLAVERGEAVAELDRGDYEAANQTLLGAVAECDARGFAQLCARLEYQRVATLSEGHRMREADAAAVAAFARTDAHLDSFNHPLRIMLATNARRRGELALARAYAFDAMRRDPTFCSGTADAYELSAEGYVEALEPAAARRELAQGPLCDAPFQPGDVFQFERATQLVLLSRVGEKLPETAHLQADLHHARLQWSPAEKLHADAIEGNLLLESDPDAGTRLLEATLAGARAHPLDSDAEAAFEWSTLSLGWMAASRGDGAAVTRLFVENAGLADGRCTVSVGSDHERFFSVAQGPDGAPRVLVSAHAREIPPLASELLDAEGRERLRDCPEVRVLALAPIFGLPGLLPADVPWSYRGALPRYAGGATLPSRRLLVSEVEPPATLGLPPLSGHAPPAEGGDVVWLHGATATVERVLAALPSSTEVELHTHGLTDTGDSDAPILALSTDSAGKWALTARDVGALHLDGHPVVVLAACDAARFGPAAHARWGLPSAFIEAGARAVVASADALPDDGAAAFFTAFLARIQRGSSPAAALRDERLAVRQRPHGEWTDSLLLFE